MNDIRTMENIASVLAERSDCKTASAIVRQMATTERLRDEQYPVRDYPVTLFVLSLAALMMIGAVLS